MIILSLTQDCKSLPRELGPTALAWPKGHNLLEGDDVGVLELPQVLDVRLVLVPHFLDGHLLCAELAQEHGALSPAAQPLQLRDLLKGHLPRVWETMG